MFRRLLHPSAFRRALPARVASHAPPGRTRARPRLEGLEGRCLLSGISGTAQYPIPIGSSVYITGGPGGNLWFTDQQTNGTCYVGTINSATRAISEYPIPTTNCYPREITTGPDGNIYFTEFGANKLGRINPTTHAITEFSIPADSQPWGIVTGPDGNLWFAERGGNSTTGSAIDSFNPTTHVFSSYATYLGNGNYLGVGPTGLTTGIDGNLWFTTYDGAVGSINPTTHVIQEYPIPTSGATSYDIATGPDGNLWFTMPSANPGSEGQQVVSFNPNTQAFYPIAVPGGGEPYGITTGPDGNLWFAEAGTGQVGRINPTTDALTQFPISAGRGITTGPDGNLWLASGSTITVATPGQSETDLVVTQQPPSSVTAGAGFGLTVAAEDGSGDVVTSFNGTVTLSLGNNPGGDTLGGTTVNAVNGVATFSGLLLTKSDPGYALVASAGLDGEGVTGAFAVTPAAASQVVVTQQPPSSVSTNSAFTVIAAIEDQYGNIVTSANGAVTIAIGTNPGAPRSEGPRRSRPWTVS